MCYCVTGSVMSIIRGSIVLGMFFFFKQKTAYEMRISDWSSDVCSSDLRGGINFMERLPVSGIPAPAGLIAATRGNHGQSIAFAGARAGLPVTIVVPEDNNPDQVDSMEGLGADVIVAGKDFQEAREYAAQLALERGLLNIPAFHSWLVQGLTTYVADFHDSVPGLDTINVPVGMGSGTSAHLLTQSLLVLRPHILGVVAAGAHP